MSPLVAEVVNGVNWQDALIIYGPLGIGWIGMAYFIDKLIKLHKEREDAMTLREQARDSLMRETMHEQAEAYKSMAHKVGGISKAMIYVAATYGEEALKKMAHAELTRMDTG